MIKKVRLSESVLDALRQMIIDGGFAPGDKFYSEKQLTEQLGVSRSSVREAVRMLEAAGLVTVRHGKGIFILDTMPHPFQAFVGWLKDNEQPILDHFEVRLIMEPSTAWYAAERARPEDIEALGRICEGFVANARINNTTETIRYDREFHKVLAKSSGNKTLHAFMKSMTNAQVDGWISSFHTPGRMEKTVNEHDAVYQAVRRRDPEGARAAMAAHLENAIRDIREAMKH